MDSDDPVVERIREVRRRLTREAKGDVRAYCDRIRELEKHEPELLRTTRVEPSERKVG